MSTKILQIKVTLKNVKPPVWRRVLVQNDITFYKLNKIIQAVMGWSGYHLYEFNIYGEAIGEKNTEWDDGYKIRSAKRVKLNSYPLEPKSKFTYIYDFGDDWVHEILVEKVLQPEEGVRYPVCIKGKRNCPPEDVGGPWGYQDFLEAINNPQHSQHEEMLEWVGGEFDPEEFDLDGINECLKKV